MLAMEEEKKIFHRPRPKKTDRETRAQLYRDILARADELEAEGRESTAEHLRFTVRWLREQQ